LTPSFQLTSDEYLRMYEGLTSRGIGFR